MGRRLKVKVELFPARANLESFGLRIEKNRGEEDEEEEEAVVAAVVEEEEQERERKKEKKGRQPEGIGRDGRYKGGLLLGTILDDGRSCAGHSQPIVS